MVSRPERRPPGRALPVFQWDTLAEARSVATAHPDGLVDLTVGTPVDPVPVASYLLSDVPGTEVALDDLLRFFDNPARAFLRARLGLVLPEVPERRDTGIPIELGPLERWGVGERMLQAVLAGRPGDVTEQAELWRGGLPPDALGTVAMASIKDEVLAVSLDTDASANEPLIEKA